MSRQLKLSLLDWQQKGAREGAGAWLFDQDKIEPWAYADNVFTKAQCNTIIQIGKNLGPQVARIGGVLNDHEDQVIRKSQTSWIQPNENTKWIFQAVTMAAEYLNSQFFNFELIGLVEGLQFTEYAEPGGHYTPHTDTMYKGVIRKLSLSIQLSDPEMYEGGEVIINTGVEVTAPKRQGTMIAFPSYTLHGVKPVTKGTRYSLVAWVTGPAFK